MGTRIAPWSMAYFTAAALSMLLAEGLFASSLTYPVTSLGAPWTLVAVHLITIGWLTLLILGALHQFVPVIAARDLAYRGSSGLTLVFVVAGLLGMLLGFMSLPGGPLYAGLRVLLPVGGALVTAGVMVAILNISLTLGRSRPLVLPSRMVAVGLGFLLATVLFGLTLALALTNPGLFPPRLVGALAEDGLMTHLLGGIGGFFTLTAMGVAYKLLAMFTLAPDDRGVWGEVVFHLTSWGLVTAWLAGLLGLFWPGAGLLRMIGQVGGALAIVGIWAYVFDMARLYRARRRPHLELNAKMAAVAFAVLAITALWLGLGFLTDRLSSLAPALIYLFLFGWLGGLGLSQLYKIVPFLTWIERYGPQLGRGRVPKVQDLVVEAQAWPWFCLYFTAVGLGAWASYAAQLILGQLAFGLQALATLSIGYLLWRVRHRPPRTRDEISELIL